MTEPRFIRLDLFPAIAVAKAPDGSEQVFDPTRTIVTDSEIYVYKDGYGSVATAFQGSLVDFGGSGKTGWTAELDDGTEIRVTRSGGCGCGSLLRAFAPFRGIPYQPTG